MSNKTFGIYIFNPVGNLLVCHPNEMQSDIWGIPKGRPEAGELPVESAIREVYEETGLNVKDLELKYVGTERYTHKDKVLHAYTTELPMTISHDRLKCRSKFRSHLTGNMIPEIDEFKWVEFHSFKDKIQSEQVRLWERYLVNSLVKYLDKVS